LRGILGVSERTFPGVSEIVKIIDSIVSLIDKARFNKEALPIMKLYLLEVRRVIATNGRNNEFDDQHMISLMKALEDWEKFLVQYTKAKMKTLLRKRKGNDEQVRVKIYLLAPTSYKQASTNASVLRLFR
jgi:hypothetical protein